ncbi:MAG: transcription antitermination factor NusB [Bryobacteraceae bacterium]
MPSRSRSRQRALQVLFQRDVRQQPAEEAISAFYDSLYSEDESAPQAPSDPFMEELVTGTVGKLSEIDARITAASEHWRLERMPAVDRNILRLAIFEMMNQATPAAVVIDEALELARRFSGDESVSFVNGVLDAVHRRGNSSTIP